MSEGSGATRGLKRIRGDVVPPFHPPDDFLSRGKDTGMSRHTFSLPALVALTALAFAVGFALASLVGCSPARADGLWPYDDGPLSWMVRPGPRNLFLMPGVLHCPAGGGIFDEVDDALKAISRRYSNGTPEADQAITQVLRYAGAKGCGKLKGTAAIEIFHVTPEDKSLIRFRFLGDPNKNIYEVETGSVCFPRSTEWGCAPWSGGWQRVRGQQTRTGNHG
jgi:hypothetical protein